MLLHVDNAKYKQGKRFVLLRNSKLNLDDHITYLSKPIMYTKSMNTCRFFQRFFKNSYIGIIIPV